MQTTDESLLWLSEADHLRSEQRRAKAAETSQAGEPIELPSKPLDLVVRGNTIWVAENGFVARRVDLETGKTKATFRGHNGPVACIALYRLPGGRQLLFTGSWDKSIRVWDAQTAELLMTVEKAHADFVKALHVIPELQLLVSGGSDRDIRLWDLSSLTDGSSSTLRPYKSLKAHTRPVERFASYPLPSSDRHILHSADSMGRMCVWQLHRERVDVVGELKCEWRSQETAVYDVAIDVDKGQIWTASGDKTALLSTFDPTRPEVAPTPVLRIEHPYYVKAVLPLDDRLVTGSTDEGVRVWDVDALRAAEGGKQPRSDSKTQSAVGWKTAAAPSLQAAADDAEPGLLRLVDVHSHEVNRLALWTRLTAKSDIEQWIVSASLDGTLRRWKWADLLSLSPPPPVIAPAAAPLATDNGHDGMTEDEEAELAALMQDD